MAKWRDHWRLLFGRSSVNIKGKYSYDETIERLNLVLARRFLSSHFRHTLAGGPNDQGRLEFTCSYNLYFMRHLMEQTKGRGRFPIRTAIALRFIGDLEIDKGGYIWLRGHLKAGKTERNASLLLLLFLLTGLLLLPWAFGGGAAVFITIVLGLILVPALLLVFTLVFFEATAEKLNEMLRLVMTEPLE